MVLFQVLARRPLGREETLGASPAANHATKATELKSGSIRSFPRREFDEIKL